MTTSTAAQEPVTVISAEAAAELLGLSRSALYAAAREGVIPCRRVGRRFIFVREVLARWLLHASAESS